MIYFEHEEQELQYKIWVEYGDPRRCRAHPHVTTSSPDGMFDAPCYACEGEMEEASRAYRESLQEACPTPAESQGMALAEMGMLPPAPLDDSDIPF